MGIKQVLSAPRSPWQRAYAERLIGSIRRECLDHVIVFGGHSLRRTLTEYCAYHHNWGTHLSLGKDAPQSRRIQRSPTVKELRLPKAVVSTIITNAEPPDALPILREGPVASDLGLSATGITTGPDLELFEALPIVNLLMERVSRLRISYRATFEFFVGTDAEKFQLFSVNME